MPQASPIQTNFTSGELSPQMRGRVDLKQYLNSAKKLRNFIVRPQGGVARRTGSLFVVETKSSGAIAFLEFEYSDTVTYIIEVGNGYMRFIKNGVQILNAGIPVEVASPWLTADLPFLQVAQSADVMYICHPAYPTRTLNRLSDISWVLGLYANLDGPYLPQNGTDTSMTLSNVQDSASMNNTVNEFAGGDVGKYIEYTRDGNVLIALVTSFVNAGLDIVTPLDDVLTKLDPTSTVTFAAGVITSTLGIFSRDNVGSYIKVTAGQWYQITGFTDTGHVTAGAALTMVATTGKLTMSGRIINCQCTASTNVFVASDVGRHIRFNFSTEQVWGTISAFTATNLVTVTLDRAIPSRGYDARTLTPSVSAGDPPPVYQEPQYNFVVQP